LLIPALRLLFETFQRACHLIAPFLSDAALSQADNGEVQAISEKFRSSAAFPATRNIAGFQATERGSKSLEVENENFFATRSSV
jgi:hypothetical protein